MIAVRFSRTAKNPHKRNDYIFLKIILNSCKKIKYILPVTPHPTTNFAMRHAAKIAFAFILMLAVAQATKDSSGIAFSFFLSSSCFLTVHLCSSTESSETKKKSSEETKTVKETATKIKEINKVFFLFFLHYSFFYSLSLSLSLLFFLPSFSSLLLSPFLPFLHPLIFLFFLSNAFF